MRKRERGKAPRRPRLAWSFTIASHAGEIWLVAGEDMRYTLRAEDGAAWLPALLELCDGSRTIDELVAGVAQAQRSAAREVLEQLYGERVLVDGTALDAHVSAAARATILGASALAERLGQVFSPAATPDSDDSDAICVLVQDNLDYAAALEHNKQCLAARRRWLWLTTGPMSRGYVSPLFLPDAGPCLACLLRHFQRLSPVPAVYEVLVAHGQRNGHMATAAFPPAGEAILAHLAHWKIGLCSREPAPAPLYRMHALEADSMELSQHQVFADPECPTCARYRD